MSGLSRSALVVFIFFAIQFWTQIAVEKFEDSWVAAGILIGSGILFIVLGGDDD